MDLYDLLLIHLKERGFRADIWSETGILLAHKPFPDSSLARWVVIDDEPGNPNDTRKTVGISDCYPKIDEGENNTIARADVIIEFADPKSLDVLDGWLDRKDLGSVS